MLDSKSLRDDKIFMLIEISFVCNSSGVGNDGWVRVWRRQTKKGVELTLFLVPGSGKHPTKRKCSQAHTYGCGRPVLCRRSVHVNFPDSGLNVQKQTLLFQYVSFKSLLQFYFIGILFCFFYWCKVSVFFAVFQKNMFYFCHFFCAPFSIAVAGRMLTASLALMDSFRWIIAVR